MLILAFANIIFVLWTLLWPQPGINTATKLWVSIVDLTWGSLFFRLWSGFQRNVIKSLKYATSLSGANLCLTVFLWLGNADRIDNPGNVAFVLSALVKLSLCLHFAQALYFVRWLKRAGLAEMLSRQWKDTAGQISSVAKP